MKRLAAFAALGVALFAVGALADRTYVYLSASVTVDAITFRFSPAEVVAEVCAHTALQGGGSSSPTCQTTVLAPGAFRTEILAIRDNRAIPFWKTQEGL